LLHVGYEINLIPLELTPPGALHSCDPLTCR